MPNNQENNKGNIDKLSIVDKIRLVTSKNSSDVLDFAMKEKNQKSPVTEVYSPDQVETATHTIAPEVYEATLEEQNDLLVKGAADINKKMEEISKAEKDTAEKPRNEEETEKLNFSVGEIIVGNSQEKEGPNKEDDGPEL